MRKITILATIYVLFQNMMSAQTHFPGGVPGAEAWYIATEYDNEADVYQNHGTPHIDIKRCSGEMGG
ncbi:MAG TPA: hypothetical protein VFR70_05120, partial [Flavobacterium sp.]|nr:hypothetical protein [Flavobacterium sp.]